MNRGTMGVNSLPKTVTRQRRDCDLNPDPSAPESSTLTTRLPSHRPLNYRLLCQCLTVGGGLAAMVTSSVHGSPGRTLVSRNSRVNSGGECPAATAGPLTALRDDSTRRVFTTCFSPPACVNERTNHHHHHHHLFAQ